MRTANKIRIFHGTKHENDSQALTEKLCRTFVKLTNFEKLCRTFVKLTNKTSRS